jgi:membrane protease YdiL (CAAX protease family)
LAAVAGISEEILFRGVLQPWLENSWGIVAGLIISSVKTSLFVVLGDMTAV